VNARLYLGDARVEAIAPTHRGIAYGDGLFETMRIHDGDVLWWDRHYTRLRNGAARLGFGLPAGDFLAGEVAAIAREAGHGVLKLVCSRGAGGRGYAPDPHAPCDWQLSTHPLPAPPPAAGLTLRWCTTRLSAQPLLAGLKHCNRLEQVLARAEWNDAQGQARDADEGLMRDMSGNLVCATSANVFALRAARWVTPAVDECGVAGVCRGVLLELLQAEEATLPPHEVEAADAVFLCNAVRGILPVARLAGRAWAPHPAVARAQALLAAQHPAFAPETS
jgi:4-amino-4-deoxychorismate lyase